MANLWWGQLCLVGDSGAKVQGGVIRPDGMAVALWMVDSFFFFDVINSSKASIALHLSPSHLQTYSFSSSWLLLGFFPLLQNSNLFHSLPLRHLIQYSIPPHLVSTISFHTPITRCRASHALALSLRSSQSLLSSNIRLWLWLWRPLPRQPPPPPTWQ
mgnify:CR=1 FL=1